MDNKKKSVQEYGNYHQYYFMIILILWDYPRIFVFNALLLSIYFLFLFIWLVLSSLFLYFSL